MTRSPEPIADEGPAAGEMSLVEHLAPERLGSPESWQAEADHLAGIAAPYAQPLPVVGGSNGCSPISTLLLHHSCSAQG